jgi:hypothetical protein
MIGLFFGDVDGLGQIYAFALILIRCEGLGNYIRRWVYFFTKARWGRTKGATFFLFSAKDAAVRNDL